MASLVPLYRMSLVRDGSARVEERPRVDGPAVCARIVSGIIPDDSREHFGVILLNVRHKVVGVVEVSVGCQTSSLVHPREVFGVAVAHQAAAIALYHNHPSGDPEPSAEDISLTRRLAAGGTLLGIEVIDHIIVGAANGRWVSLKERGVL